MSLNEVSLRIPTEHMVNVFGQFDANIKKIERTLKAMNLAALPSVKSKIRQLHLLPAPKAAALRLANKS